MFDKYKVFRDRNGLYSLSIRGQVKDELSRRLLNVTTTAVDVINVLKKIENTVLKQLITFVT